jgi:CBS domain-containing protein
MGAAMDRPAANITVGDAMSPVIATVRSDEQLDLVEDVMSLGQLRHLPVVDDRKLVGVVSQRDLLAAGLSRALEFDGQERRSFLRSISVSDVMSSPPVTAQPEDTLFEAAGRLLVHRIGCLPVVGDEGQAIGIISETDLLRVAFGLDARSNEPVDSPDVG